jgi:hypothetical protein
MQKQMQAPTQSPVQKGAPMQKGDMPTASNQYVPANPAIAMARPGLFGRR